MIRKWKIILPENKVSNMHLNTRKLGSRKIEDLYQSVQNVGLSTRHFSFHEVLSLGSNLEGIHLSLEQSGTESSAVQEFHSLASLFLGEQTEDDRKVGKANENKYSFPSTLYTCISWNFSHWRFYLVYKMSPLTKQHFWVLLCMMFKIDAADPLQQQ